MAYKKCDAVILRRTRFSESSLVVWLFTREFGRVEALAKGCRRPRSPMCGHLDLYNQEEVVVYERPRGSLDLVTESHIIDESTGMRRNPQAFAMAGVLAEVVASTCMLHDPHPVTYAALCRAFEELSTGQPVARSGIAGLLRVLTDVGFQPRLDQCLLCEAPAEQGREWRLSGTAGGLVCQACGMEGEALSAGLLASLRYLANHPGDAGGLKLAPREAWKAVDLLIRYIEDSIGKGLRSGRILRSVREGQ